MLRVWGRRNSINVQKVMWLVGELAIAHEHIPAGGSFGGLDTAEFRTMNPHGRVPVIDDGGTVVWESHSILRYLAARHSNGSLWSDDPAIRSDADRWMDWAQTVLQPDFIGGVFWGFYRTPEDRRDWSAIGAAVSRCSAHVVLLDRILADRPYLGGAAFGLADIPAGTMLYRYFGLELERPRVRHVEAWYRRLQDRPAYRKHVMLPFDDLRGRLAY